MFSLGSHDKEHERLIRQLRFYPQPVTTLPPAATNTTQRVTYNNVDYYSDGTRWLSVMPLPHMLTYSPGITFPASATAAAVLRNGPPDDVTSIYITKAVIKVTTLTTLDVTNNWTTTLRKTSNAGATSNVVAGVSTFAGGRVAGTPYLNTITVNAAFLVTDIYILSVDVTKNAAPGNLNFEPITIWYRLIGT